MIHYADIQYNDFVNGAKGVCLSYWAQGCPFRCKGCHNPETWSYEGGKVDSEANIIDKVITKITSNKITRNFSVLGGEPLCDINFNFVSILVDAVRKRYPDILIFVWTGYVYEELLENRGEEIKKFLENIDYLIDGPYIEKLRDVTLFLRGSSNQRVIDMKATLASGSVVTVEEI